MIEIIERQPTERSFALTLSELDLRRIYSAAILASMKDDHFTTSRLSAHMNALRSDLGAYAKRLGIEEL